MDGGEEGEWSMVNCQWVAIGRRLLRGNGYSRKVLAVRADGDAVRETRCCERRLRWNGVGVKWDFFVLGDDRGMMGVESHDKMAVRAYRESMPPGVRIPRRIPGGCGVDESLARCKGAW